jgi:hypothetical protein
MTFLAGFLFGTGAGLLIASLLLRRWQRRTARPTPPLVTRPHDWPHDQ